MNKTNINYNNINVANISSKDDLTINCSNRKLKTDIKIACAEDRVIQYNGKSTNVSAGKTAVLKCRGKKMTGSVKVEAVILPDLITFTMGFGVKKYTYQAEPGMTWRDFVASEYNKPRTNEEGYEIIGKLYRNGYDNSIYYEQYGTGAGVYVLMEDKATRVFVDDAIIPDYSYVLEYGYNLV